MSGIFSRSLRLGIASIRCLWLDRSMQAMLIPFHHAMLIAQSPVSRFAFGSPCRFVARIDWFCHLFVPAILQSGDTFQCGLWDACRVFLSLRLVSTSPRWQWLVKGVASV